MKRSHLLLAGLSAIAIVGAIAPSAFLQPSPTAPTTPAPSSPGAAPSPTTPSTPSPPSPGAAPSPSTPKPPTIPNPGSEQPAALPIEAGQVPNQGLIIEAIANIVIQKFQNVSCEELAQMQPAAETNATSSDDPQAAMKEQAITLLKANPEMREQFINQVAPVIANKMFDCNFIP